MLEERLREVVEVDLGRNLSNFGGHFWKLGFDRRREEKRREEEGAEEGRRDEMEIVLYPIPIHEQGVWLKVWEVDERGGFGFLLRIRIAVCDVHCLLWSFERSVTF